MPDERNSWVSSRELFEERTSKLLRLVAEDLDKLLSNFKMHMCLPAGPGGILVVINFKLRALPAENWVLNKYDFPTRNKFLAKIASRLSYRESKIDRTAEQAKRYRQLRSLFFQNGF